MTQDYMSLLVSHVLLSRQHTLMSDLVSKDSSETIVIGRDRQDTGEDKDFSSRSDERILRFLVIDDINL